MSGIEGDRAARAGLFIGLVQGKSIESVRYRTQNVSGKRKICQRALAAANSAFVG
jgi:hypothetical protein